MENAFLRHPYAFLRLYANDYNCNWEPVSQDVYPWSHSNSVSCPERLSRTCSPHIILYPSYLRMYAMGKGLVGLLKPWGILFIYSEQPVEKYIRPCLNWGGYSFYPLLMPKSELSLSPLYFNKTLLHKSSERSSLVSGPKLNSSPPGARNPGVVIQQQPFKSTGSVELWYMALVAPQHMESSWTRDQTHVPCVGRQTVNPLHHQESPCSV